MLFFGFWFLSEILLNHLLRSHVLCKEGCDIRKNILIWVVVFGAVFGADFWAEQTDMPLYQSPLLGYLGLSLLLVGVSFRVIVITSLDRLGEVSSTRADGYRFKQDGIYKYLRHPSYTASFLSFVGFGLVLNNWLSMLFIVLVVFVALLMRIKFEERLLVDLFGEEYIEYQENTKSFLPGLV